MDNNLITEYNHFIQTLQAFPKEWLNNYFNALRNLLTDLGLTNSSPQLAMSVTADGNLHVNIGQRWVSKPFNDGGIGLILPMNIDPDTLNCERIGYFTARKMPEAQWVAFDFRKSLPQTLFSHWLQASGAEVKRVKTKSGFRKHHSTLFFETVMSEEARKEIMREAFDKEGVA